MIFIPVHAIIRKIFFFDCHFSFLLDCRSHLFLRGCSQCRRQYVWEHSLLRYAFCFLFYRNNLLGLRSTSPTFFRWGILFSLGATLDCVAHGELFTKKLPAAPAPLKNFRSPLGRGAGHKGDCPLRGSLTRGGQCQRVRVVFFSPLSL